MNDNTIFAYEYYDSDIEAKQVVSFISTADSGLYKVIYVRTALRVPKEYSFKPVMNNRYRLESIVCIVPPLRGMRDYTEDRRLPEPVLQDEIALREREWMDDAK